MLKASSLVLGESNSKKLAKISLSDSTIKTQIDELANDIECQFLQKIHASPYFAIQCDETTDVAQLSQLIVYVCFVGSATIEEEMLCYSANRLKRPLKQKMCSELLMHTFTKTA